MKQRVAKAEETWGHLPVAPVAGGLQAALCECPGVGGWTAHMETIPVGDKVTWEPSDRRR